MKTDRETIYAAIDQEREYQKNLWGDHPKALENFIVYMEDYLAQARHEISRLPGDPPMEALETIRKVVTLGVAAMEQHGVVLRGYSCPTKEDLTRHKLFAPATEC